jgi:hypothetical protein
VQHPEYLAGGRHDVKIPADDLGPGVGGARLALGPGDQLVQVGDVVLDQAADDVFLRLEVVIQRGLGDAELLGDLAQGCLLVALLGKQLEGKLAQPRPGVLAAILLIAADVVFQSLGF